MVGESEASTGTSFPRIAKEVFQDSLVTGIPNIVTEHHKSKKILKMLYFCVCVLGFSLQVTSFLELYSAYPTMIEINFPRNLLIMKPAMTFCNRSPVKRSLYCKKYQNMCQKPANFTLFCKRYPYYCPDGPNKMENFTVMPETNSYYALGKISKEDMIEMKHKPTFIHGSQRNVFLKDAYITMVDKRYFAICYRINYRGDDDLPPSTLDWTDLKTDRIIFNRKSRTLIDQFKIDMTSHEIVSTEIKPGAILAIHNPFDPFFNPHVLEPEKEYRIFIRVEQEKLLPYPYATDCRNYTKEWLSNGKKGPKSKEMCIVMCEMKSDGCLCKSFGMFDGDAFLLKNFCGNSCKNLRIKERFDKDECLENCKENCEKWRYIYTIQEINASIPDERFNDSALVELYAQEPPLTVISHKARIETIEVFSYIGGYLGLWLGLSAFAFIDFLHSLIELFYLSVQRTFRRLEVF